MIKKISFMILLSTCAFAQILPVEGETWPFAEKNAVQELKGIAERDKDIINARMDKAKTEATEKFKHYKAPNAVSLPTASKDSIYYPDMKYTLEDDIRDANGKLLYPKGFTFNIMDYTALNMKIIIFDPTVKSQMEWFNKSGYATSLTDMVLITDGEAFDVIDKIKRPVFYLTKPIVDRFKLKFAPCVIEQDGKKIKITEISPEKGSKNAKK